MRDLEVAPRLAVAWSPHRLHNTKFSSPVGRVLRLHQPGHHLGPSGPGESLHVLPSDGTVRGPVTDLVPWSTTARSARPRYQTASVDIGAQAAVRILRQDAATPGGWGRAASSSTRPRRESGRLFYDGRGLRTAQLGAATATTLSILPSGAPLPGSSNGSSATRGRARAPMPPIDYSLENPVFAAQMPGPFAWDTPNRVHMWGWAPLPKRVLPRAAALPVHRIPPPPTWWNTAPGSRSAWWMRKASWWDGPSDAAVPGLLQCQPAPGTPLPLHALPVGLPSSGRISYCEPERQRGDRIQGSPRFLSYGHGQARAFSVRLRLLGRK